LVFKFEKSPESVGLKTNVAVENGIIYPLAGINQSKTSFELAMPKGLLLLPGLNLPFNVAGLGISSFST